MCENRSNLLTRVSFAPKVILDAGDIARRE